MFIAAIEHDRHSKMLLQEMGVYNKVKDKLVEKSPYKTKQLDNNLSEAGGFSKKLVAEIRGLLQAQFKSENANYWEEKLNSAGIPCAINRTIEQWMKEKEARKSAFVIDANSETFGKMTQMGLAVTLGTTPEACLVPQPPQNLDKSLISQLE